MTIQENTNDHYQRYWDYLHILARMQMGPQFAGKLDVSGVVQQTLWEACAAHQQICPLDEAQRVAFLRRILVNNMKDEIRKFSTAARDIARELSLEAVDASSQRLAALIATDQPPPSEAVLREGRSLCLYLVRACFKTVSRPMLAAVSSKNSPSSERESGF